MNRCAYCGHGCFGRTCQYCTHLGKIERAMRGERETGRTGAPSLVSLIAAPSREAVPSTRERGD